MGFSSAVSRTCTVPCRRHCKDFLQVGSPVNCSTERCRRLLRKCYVSASQGWLLIRRSNGRLAARQLSCLARAASAASTADSLPSRVGGPLLLASYLARPSHLAPAWSHGGCRVLTWRGVGEPPHGAMSQWRRWRHVEWEAAPAAPPCLLPYPAKGPGARGAGVGAVDVYQGIACVRCAL